VARPGVFATLETPGAARIAPHGSRRAAQARRLGRSHDCVPFWRRFSGRRHHRVPKGALYDLKDPQRHLCPTSLLRTVTVGTFCRCPAAVGQLPTRTMALGPVPGASAKHAMTRLIHWRIACRCRAAGRRDLRSCPALVCLAMEAARWVPGRGALWQRCVSGPGISIPGRDACLHKADPSRLALRARGQGAARTANPPAAALGYQPRNSPWLAHRVASEAAMAAATTATTRRRTGRSADQRRPSMTARRVSPITM
jgi:hypothetical protein